MTGDATPSVPKSVPASAVPSTVAQSTEAASEVSPVRLTATKRFAVPSVTVAVGSANWMVFSLSVIVTVVLAGVPSWVFTGLDRLTLKVRDAFAAALSVMGTVMVLAAPSPSAQLSVPEVVV